MATQIDKLQGIPSLVPRTIEKKNAGSLVNELGETAFGTVFRSAINDVVQTDKVKNNAEYLLATGQLDNPAALTIASTKHQIAVDLLIQLRNKALDAYTELTRMSV